MKTRIYADDRVMISYSAQSVWAVIADIKQYPQWWPKSLNLKLLSEGDSAGVTLRIKPSGGQEFFCRVESSNGASRMLIRYFGGFITGTGEWNIEPLSHGCTVSYTLDVEADGLLIGLIGMFVNLGRIHSQMMESVFHGLEQELEKREQN
ncbi:SRPBCC family protein [Sulfuricurvum sp.]|uniref:SRPBCC family protein n=1 Tax=Sulfuricurvum sp. TaxID=2025608 RepID=UPI003C53E5F8